MRLAQIYSRFRESITRRDLIFHTAIYAIGLSLAQIFNLISVPIFLPYLTNEDFGKIALFINFSIGFTVLGALGIGSSLGQYYFDFPNHPTRKSFLSSLFLTSLVLNLILCLLVLLFRYQFSAWLAFGELKYLIYFCIFFSTSALAIPMECFYKFENKSIYFISTNLFSFLTGFFLSWGLLRSQALPSVEAYIIGQITSKVLLLILFTLPVFRISLDFFQASLTVIRSTLGNGILMVPAFLGLFALQYTGPFILKKYNSLEQSGVFHIGYTYGAAINFLISPFAIAWFSYFMRNQKEATNSEKDFADIYFYYNIVVGGIVILGIILYLGLLAFPEFNNFKNYSRVSILVAAGFFCMGLFNLLLPYFYYAKKIEQTTMLQLTGAAFFLVISFTIGSSLTASSIAFLFFLANALIVVLTYRYCAVRQKKLLAGYLSPTNTAIWILILAGANLVGFLS